MSDPKAKPLLAVDAPSVLYRAFFALPKTITDDAGRPVNALFGAVNMASTLGMAMGPWAGGWLYDAYASYFWLYIGSFGIGLGAVAIAFTFRPPREVAVGLPSVAQSA